MSDFDKVMDFIFQHEGGYVNNPADPGGETRWGICKRAYPDLDIKNLSQDDAKEIYRKDYWEKINGEALVWPMNLLMMDTAVNMGVSKAIEFENSSLDVKEYLLLRMIHYVNLNKPQFLMGWLRRCVDLFNVMQSDEHPISI